MTALSGYTAIIAEVTFDASRRLGWGLGSNRRAILESRGRPTACGRRPMLVV